jgi:hypothetical protein
MAREKVLKQIKPVGRRSFLQMAAGAVAFPWVGAQASTALNPQSKGAIPENVPQCPVGFVKPRKLNSAIGGDVALAQQRIIPAERLWYGDSQLKADGVRLQFEGIRLPDVQLSERLQSLTVDLVMDTADAGSIPWNLWSYSNFDIQNMGGGLDILVPLRNDGSLLLDMTVQWDGLPSQRYQAALTTGRAWTLPKLCPGTYCIPVAHEEVRFPAAWNQTRWEDTGDVSHGAMCLPAHTCAPATAGTPVSFPHLVFTVDNVTPDNKAGV